MWDSTRARAALQFDLRLNRTEFSQLAKNRDHAHNPSRVGRLREAQGGELCSFRTASCERSIHQDRLLVLPDGGQHRFALVKEVLVRNAIPIGKTLWNNLEARVGIELEAVCGRERSVSPQAKS